MASYSEIEKQKQALRSKMQKGKNPSQALAVNLKPLLSTQQNYSDAKTLAEFLMQTLTRSLEIPREEALQLEADSGKYFIHMIITGVKGSFEKIILWYKEVYEKMNELVKILEIDPEGWNAVAILLAILKAGLRAPNSRVQFLAKKVIERFLLELNAKGHSERIWDWFLSEKGLWKDLLVLTGPKFTNLTLESLNVILQCASNSLPKLLLQILEKELPSYPQYLQAVGNLLQVFKELKNGIEKLRRENLLEHWIDQAFEKAQRENSDFSERAEAIKFLSETWIEFPIFMEEKAEAFINLIQNAASEKWPSLQLNSVALMIRLLENFIIKKYRFSGSILKALNFVLMENFTNESLRQIALKNIFTLIGQEGVSLGLLLNPLIKHIQLSEGMNFSLNICDFEFLSAVAKHPKLQLGNALQLLEILGEIYINDIIYSSCALSPLLLLVCRFYEFQLCQNFLLKYLKKLVEIYNDNVHKIVITKKRKTAKLCAIEIIMPRAQNARISKLSTIILETIYEIKNLMREKDGKSLLLLEKIVDTENKEEEDYLSMVNSISRKHNTHITMKSVNEGRRKIHNKSEANKTIDYRGSEINTEGNTSFEQILGNKRNNTMFTSKKESLIGIKTDQITRRTQLQEIINRKNRPRTPIKQQSNSVFSEKIEELSLPEESIPHFQPKQTLLISLCNIQSEEQKEQEAILMFNDMHQRGFQFLFQKYAGSLSPSIRPRVFSTQQPASEYISLQEIYQMLKDHSITFKMLTQAELTEFVRLMNEKFGKATHKGMINFEEFVELFSQLAIYIFNQDPKFTTFPPVYLEKILMDYFFKTATANGENQGLFYTKFLYGTERIVDFQYKGDPTKKLIERKKLVDRYVVREYFPFPEPVRICLQIVDEIMASIFETHIIEPITLCQKSMWVLEEKNKSNPADETHIIRKRMSTEISKDASKKIPEKVPLKILMPSPIVHETIPTFSQNRFNERKEEIEVRIPRKKEPRPTPLVERIVKPKHSLHDSQTPRVKPVYTPNMLKLLAQYPKTEKPIIKEVISTLGEIIAIVEQNKARRLSTIRSRALQTKINRSEEQKRIIEQRHLMQEKRENTIGHMITDMKRAKFPYATNTTEHFLPEINKSTTMSNARRINGIQKYSTDNIPENSEEDEYLREQKLIDKEEEAFRRLEMERLCRYYKTKENTKRQADKIRIQLNNISKMREEAKLEREQEEKSIAEKRKLHQMYLHRQFEEDKERQEEMNIKRQIIIDFIESDEIALVLRKYQKQIQYLFKHYSRQLENISPSLRSEYTIDFQKCLKFMHDFQIVPQLLPSEESVRVFRQATKALSLQRRGEDRGRQELKEEDFGKFLVRLALVLKHRIDEEGRKLRMNALNLSCDIYEADPYILVNLFKYMRIFPEDKLA